MFFIIPEYCDGLIKTLLKCCKFMNQLGWPLLLFLQFEIIENSLGKVIADIFGIRKQPVKDVNVSFKISG